MKVFRVLVGFIILTVSLIGTSRAGLTPILDVNSSQYSIGDFDIVHPGNELQIDYFVKNVSTFTDPGNAFKNIEITAGTDQGVYAAWAPEGWETVFYEDKIRFHTADSTYYIYPGETEPTLFSLLYYGTKITIGQSQAMTPLGLWTDPVPVLIATPEPLTIVFLGLGMLCLRRKKLN